MSNVTAQPAVQAFVTEDGGLLLPPGAGQWFLHTCGEFEKTLVSVGQNTVAFVAGVAMGLSDAHSVGSRSDCGA